METLGKKISVIQFDAHLDWTNYVGPQRFGNGSPMRHLSEMNHIDKMMQIGLHGLGSSGRKDFEDAMAYGSVLISSKDVHTKGIQETLKLIPKADSGRFIL